MANLWLPYFISFERYFIVSGQASMDNNESSQDDDQKIDKSRCMTRSNWILKISVLRTGGPLIVWLEPRRNPWTNFKISDLGFPLEKAIQYEKLRKPFVINDLEKQWDIQGLGRFIFGRSFEFAIANRDTIMITIDVHDWLCMVKSSRTFSKTEWKFIRYSTIIKLKLHDISFAIDLIWRICRSLKNLMIIWK